MKELTTEDYWSNLNRGSDSLDKHEFDDIFKEYINNCEGKAIEIGCVPGTILARICNMFGYKPVGIDYDKNTKEIFSKTMNNYGLDNFEVYNEDFNKWNTNEKFDLVCSFGFIEHFDNPEEILQSHLKLLKEDGKLIVEIPNFSGFNGFIHKLVDKPNLDNHNTSIMNPEFFKDFATKNNLNIVYLGYYGSWHFQWGYGRRDTANIFQKGIYALLKIISKITIHIKMRNKLSNYIFLIAEKNDNKTIKKVL